MLVSWNIKESMNKGAKMRTEPGDFFWQNEMMMNRMGGINFIDGKNVGHDVMKMLSSS